MSMPKRLFGKSRTCPLLATTSKAAPRYLLIVFAFAGDSTMTRLFLDFLAATRKPSMHQGSGGGRQGSEVGRSDSCLLIPAPWPFNAIIIIGAASTPRDADKIVASPRAPP